MTAPHFAPVDDDTADLLGLIADDPRVADDYALFLRACEDAAGMNMAGLVYVNTVRALLTDAWDCLVIEPRRLSAFWNKATGRGKPMLKLTEDEARELGVEWWQICKGSGSGNDGRPQPVRRWVG